MEKSEKYTFLFFSFGTMKNQVLDAGKNLWRWI